MAYTTKYDEYFAKASERYNVDYDLLRAVAKTESNFNATATSSAGAVGVMQLMPDTAKYLGVSKRTDPEQSIMGGAAYLSEQLKRYNGNVEMALAAYNTGPGTVNKQGITTAGRSYIDTVMGNYAEITGKTATTGTTTVGGSASNVAWYDNMVDTSAWLAPGGWLWWMVKILVILSLGMLCLFFVYKSVGGNASTLISNSK